jgi:hypothetical protein
MNKEAGVPAGEPSHPEEGRAILLVEDYTVAEPRLED